MKANELMIGDLVKVRHLNRIGKVYRLDCANGETNGLVALIDGDFDHSDIDPIPITPEILEKNGFRLTKAADRYWWAIDGTRDGAMVEITLYNPDVHGVKVLTKIHTQSSHEIGVNTVRSCDIESVHELQHALRLCGIDKEIVL